jgi:RimJ/RimL family protein N-acetyltransferase
MIAYAKNQMIPFKASHGLEVMRAGCIELGVVEPSEYMLEMLAAREDEGNSWTLIEFNKILACGGFDLLWKGVAEAWAFFTPAASAAPQFVVRSVVRTIKATAKEYNLHRIQAHVRTDLVPALDLAEWLGFKPEGINRKFTADGVDCIEFAMVTK